MKLLLLLAMGLWRLLGVLALPLLMLHPGARRHLRALPAPEPGWTWLHGASAGEHVAARALLAALEPEHAAEVWRTSSSWRTPVPDAFPAPMDLPFVFARWLDRARPGRLVLIEAELWPGWLWHCRRRGIPVVVVNARDSRGTGRWRRLGPLWRALTEGVRFIDQAQSGDLKLAAPRPAPAFPLDRPTLIAASTREGDEAALLRAWPSLPEPRPLLLLAPRHLERVADVSRLIDQAGLQHRLRSAGVDRLSEIDVLLLDSQGELGSLMSQGRAAFIGGSFDPAIGGHSPAEAIAAGLPVVGGPQRRSNPQAWSQGRSLLAAEPADLARALGEALALGPIPPPPSDAAERVAAALPSPATPAERDQRPLLWPAVPLVHGLGRLRRGWRGRPEGVDLPVISVGALAAGGAGKTPAVAWLASELRARLGGDPSGEGAVWIVARGYGRRSDGPAVRAALPGAGWEPDYLGDELEMLRRRGFPVVSAPDRVAGAREAQAQGARLILLDDGFQHRRLRRDLDIVCIDALWPGARGLIPVGSRREPWSALRRAHWIWESNAGTQPIVLPEGQELPRVRARPRPIGWSVGGRLEPLDSVQGEVLVGAGIARPERFLCSLLRLGLQPRWVRQAADHGRLDGLPAGAVVTEKDAARMPLGADVRALVLDLEVEGGEALLSAILDRSPGRG